MCETILQAVEAVLSAKKWGFYDCYNGGKPFTFQRPYGDYVIQNSMFKFVAAGMHGQSAVECAFRLHEHVKDKLSAIQRIEIFSQRALMAMITIAGVGLPHRAGNIGNLPVPLLQQVRAEVAVLHSPSWSRSAHTFSHIFAGGYAAGYYSYKWAEVLSADAYAAFEETAAEDGTADPKTGERYRTAILEAGGSRPAMESFKAFRGREPSIDALLRHQGMSVQ